MNSTNEVERKLRDLQKLITSDAIRRKEKVIAIDAETFEEVKGKEIKLRVSSIALEAMKNDLTKQMESD